MNLIFRMFYVYLLSLIRHKLPVGIAISKLNLMVLPNDLDVNLHMNNGRYLTICDLNRVDFFLRTGLLATMMQKKWMPMVAEHTMIYKKPLALFQRFTVTLTLTSWDEKAFYMTHEFKVKDRIVAIGTSKGVFRGRNGVVPPEEIIRAVSHYRAQHPRKFPPLKNKEA